MTLADLRTAAICRWVLRRRPPARGIPRWSLGIYKADRLGDFVLALGAIRLLLASAEPERSVLVVTATAAALAAREFPQTDLVIVDPCRSGAGAAAAERWRRRREDLFHTGVRDLVCLRHHRYPAESLICGTIPAARTWGAADSGLVGRAGRLATLPLDHLAQPFAPAPGECGELAQHRAVVEAYLQRPVPPSAIAPVLAPGWAGAPSAVAVSPFGSRAIRDIPPALLAAAGRYLQSAHGLPLHLLCPPGQTARFAALQHHLAAAGVTGIKLVPCDTTDALREALRHSRLVLSAETGTAHLAAALDAPLVALLGGGHLGWFAPWARSPRQQWLNEPISCQGCLWHCPHPAPLCLTSISETRLFHAIATALAASET